MTLRISGIAVFAFLAVCGLSAAADSPPVKHLVYRFTYGDQTDLEVHSSGIDASGGASGSSGTTDYSGGEGDQGTIAVDVLSQQPDKGVVLRVSEQARERRSAAPTTCVVYGTTGVICDPQATIHPEEMSLIRLLAADFFSPDKLDSKRHWQIVNSDPDYSVTSDFTVAKTAGTAMTIHEARTVKQSGPRPSTMTIDSMIDYDLARTLPTSISEYAIERNEAGMGQHNTVKTQTNLVLVSSST